MGMRPAQASAWWDCFAPVWLRRRVGRCDECGRTLDDTGTCPELAWRRRLWDDAMECYIRTGTLRPIGKRP